MTLSFTFDPNRFRQLQSNIPRIQFTCAALAQDSLPSYLRQCFKFLEYLDHYKGENGDNTSIFKYPVSAEIAPTYSSVIKNPMDFSTIREKILKSKYKNIEEFKSDVDLIWENCRTFNQGGPLFDLATRLKAHFDYIWNLHTTLEMPDEVRESMQALKDTENTLSSTILEMRNMFKFPEHPRTPHIADPRNKPKAVQIIERRDEKNKPAYSQPTEEKLNKPMSYDEKYKLAINIDMMPIELLGEVIDILSKHPKFKDDEDVCIPFNEIDNKMLRQIEAYVNENSDRENSVRRMYQDKISASDQIKTINAELQRVEERIKEKHVNADTSSAISETSSVASDSSYSDESS